MQNISISSWSFFTSVGGYGVLNNLWNKHLSKRGVDLYCAPDFAPQPGSREWEIMDQEEKALFEKEFKVQKIGISGTTPFEFHHNKSEIKIAMTMAESDRLGESWVKSCNGMHHIIVPNSFYEEVFRNSGVSVPIKVIPSGVDGERFPYYERPERDVYTFGICGYLNERKGVFELLRAFSSEFSLEEPVRLKLHTTNHFFRYYRDFKDKRISLTWDYKNFAELNEFYRSLDCFVFPSKAEGVGYPPREAMSTGLPTIVTEFSGLAEIATPYISFPLNVDRLVPRTDMLEQPGNWAEIDISQLMYWMRFVYENRDKAKKRGKQAAAELRRKFSWDVCVDKFKKFIKEEYS